MRYEEAENCNLSRYSIIVSLGGPDFSSKSKHKLELTEARINFGKLPETPAKAISLQNLHISGHIETINIKKATLPLIEVSL